jgi:hypothetical protein
MISAAATRVTLEIGPEDVGYAYDLVRDALHDVVGICEFEVAGSKTEGHMNKIRKYLRNAGPAGVTKRNLLKYGPVRTVDYLRKLLESLEEMGDIRKLPGQRADSEVWVYLNGTAQAAQPPQVPQ